MSQKKCCLCQSDQIAIKLIKPSGEQYWDCSTCGLIFLDETFHLIPTTEKQHYLTHNNDIADPRYQHFVSPVTDYVMNNIPVTSKGLDYGAGPGPVVASVLRARGFELNLYDPYFCDDKSVLENDYDFIVSTEVVEHFYSPAQEFLKLKQLLKRHGQLVIMTHLYDDAIDFKQWYYHRDPTHVVFYRIKTFEWVQLQFDFKELLKIHDRVVVLKN
jgi:hypothetical protein